MQDKKRKSVAERDLTLTCSDCLADGVRSGIGEAAAEPREEEATAAPQEAVAAFDDS